MGIAVGVMFAFAAAATAADAPDPMDWPFWRGPELNGVSREHGIPEKWSPRGENVLWKNKEAAGRSTPIVMRGKLYTISRKDPFTPKEAEEIICLDAATGEKKWGNVVNIYLTDVPDTRIGWSSVCGDPATGRIYALAGCGYFQCIDGETGKTIWSHSMSEEYGLLSTYGGRTNFPVVFEDLVIISGVMIGWGEHAKPNHRYIAFDKNSGKVVWFNATKPLPDETTYCSPIVTNVNGTAMMIVGGGDGFLYGFQPRTGEVIWKYKLSARFINMTPLVAGDTVYAGQSEENPGDNSFGMFAAVAATGRGDVSQSLTKWRARGATVGRASPLLIDNKIVTIDDAAGLTVYDANTGKVLDSQKIGTMQRVSPLFVDGRIYTCDVNGKWTTFKITPAGKIEIVQKMLLNRLVGGSPAEVHASPIVSHGRMYVQTTEWLYCIGNKGTTPSADPIPAQPTENPIGDDVEPAVIRVVPAESLVRPGEKVAFETRVYNSRGQILEKRPVTYAATKGGSIDNGGAFVASSENKQQGVIVNATLGGLKAEARVRVVPDLPWSFDFTSNEIPITWIGMRYRHVVKKVDGKPVAVKITTIPKGQRSQGWMGHPDFHDYTIQADVKGAVSNGRLPDIGLIDQHYTFDMMGNSQQLQLRSWVPTLYRSKTIPFKWQPNVWYTMKFSVAQQEGKALLKGKI